ncbi:MAG: hypothetical protein EOP11_24820 [Proteobacteria bacterium]|nr:MAG: hypothetical protein EOP11_24820 [Pseudomonadota bacterium]
MKKTLLMLLDESSQSDAPLTRLFRNPAFKIVTFTSALAALDFLLHNDEPTHAIVLADLVPIETRMLFLSEFGRRAPDLYSTLPILMLSEPNAKGKVRALSKAPSLGDPVN